MRIDQENWNFEEIAAADPKRAARLEAAGSSYELAHRLEAVLRRALQASDARFGWERAGDTRGGDRVVLQFQAGAELLDWFFNARTGYRAHFRQGWKRGQAFNDALIDRLSRALEALLPVTLVARKIKDGFEDDGEILLERSLFVSSLVPTLSKLWVCTKRLGKGGSIETLRLGVAGPRIRLGVDPFAASWPAIYPDDENAWLDIKGAFLGDLGPYQPKDPVARAKKLQDDGTA
jgi:hypothetical protein